MAVNTPVGRYTLYTGSPTPHVDFKGRDDNEVVQSLVLWSGFAGVHRRCNIMIPIPI